MQNRHTSKQKHAFCVWRKSDSSVDAFIAIDFYGGSSATIDDWRAKQLLLSRAVVTLQKQIVKDSTDVCWLGVTALNATSSFTWQN